MASSKEKADKYAKIEKEGKDRRAAHHRNLEHLLSKERVDPEDICSIGEERLKSSDHDMILEALVLLKKDKEKALENVGDGQHFTRKDFGLDRLNELVELFARNADTIPSGLLDEEDEKEIRARGETHRDGKGIYSRTERFDEE